MSKQLDEVKTLRAFNKVELKNDKNVNKSLDIIEKALQRLEEIDNANASDALESLRQLDSMDFHRSIDTYVPEIGSDVSETQYLSYTNEFYIIKQALERLQELETMAEEYDVQPAQIREALLVYRMMSSAGYGVYHIEKAQKQEEILQIIRRKGLPIIERDMLMQCENYEQYCTKYDNYNMINASMQKTEEEFNLLKRYYYEEKH